MKDGDIFWKFDDTPLELLDNGVRFEWAEYILQTVFLFRSGRICIPTLGTQYLNVNYCLLWKVFSMCCQLEIQKDLKSYDFLVIAGGDIIEIIKSNNEKIKFIPTIN